MTRADVFDVEQRAAVMRAVKGADTKPELKVRRIVRGLGLGYRLGGWGLAGKPDLVFPGRRACIFVHGCFWHGHECKRGARVPKDNNAYWVGKIARNRARDAAALKSLAEQGWHVLVIWECDMKDEAALTATLARFLKK